MKYYINSKELSIDSPTLTGIFSLLCSLEYSNAAMTWYAGSIAGRQDLPPHESILALAFNIASVAEALQNFDHLTSKNIIKLNDNWDATLKEMFEFLKSSEVAEFKRNHLKLIRDKSVFHVDPQPIKSYIEKEIVSEKNLTIWETDLDGRKGHSPIAAEIIGEYLKEATFHNEDSARMSSEIFGAIRSIVLQYISDNFKIITDEEI